MHVPGAVCMSRKLFHYENGVLSNVHGTMKGLTLNYPYISKRKGAFTRETKEDDVILNVFVVVKRIIKAGHHTRLTLTSMPALLSHRLQSLLLLLALHPWMHLLDHCWW